MTTLTIIETDCITGETIERPMTAEEVSAREAAAAAFEADRLAQEEATAAREALKSSAKAKLIAGQPLTAEEADVLVF